MADETQTRTISIKGQTFEISAPYAEGHTVNAAEANVLNQTRAENIGNNVRKRVDDALKIEDEAERNAALAKVQEDVAKYDAEYVFNMSSGRTTISTTPEEREARKIAKAVLTRKLKEAGTTFKAYKDDKGEDYVEEKLATIMEMDAVKKEAARAVAEAKKAQERLEKVEL